MKNFTEQVKRHISLLIFSIFILVIDQLSKKIILASGIYHLKNYGVVFGLLSSQAMFVIIIIIALLALLIFKRNEFGKDFGLDLAFGAILGGGVSNLIDRLVNGYIIDFVDIKIWPVFNLADLAISLGVIFALYYSVVKNKLN